MERQVFPFSSRQAFQQQLRLCLSRAERRLRLFDPDFALWDLGTGEVEAILRPFLLGGGGIALLAHSDALLERQCPRLLRLLTQFGHRFECRVSSKNLRHLTDSFCIADDLHLVRRFHSDHLRGEAVFDSEADTRLCAERFAGMWLEAEPGLHPSTAGL
ncbi:hypothetical protein [Janthinobacterium fluminis]|uniref:DUF7931 domain-containing protein n=1 Tax=Janthinobacterium fluminis TaxID=2987524 RepID=A0ABT5K2H4_9BURK|nr:hypothetical protein [Janthinobacterium fluminis]MDC8759189.1 hypothetical protein [Janthinobacterium fluminis]